MKITFLGTGTSHGVPVIACKCEVCLSEDPRDKRFRSSVLVEDNGVSVVVDTGPDFRMQMLREGVERLDAVLFTHEHKDHTAGFDDIRSFNFVNDRDMDVYATERVQRNLRQCYDYIFADVRYPGIPQVALHTIGADPFSVYGMPVIPIQVKHLHLPVLGFRFGDFVYITDTNFIPEEEKDKIYGCSVLVLNALRIQKHISHFNLEEAVEMALELNAGTTYFTHISHQLGLHEEVEKNLPPNIRLSYDGLKLEM